MTSLTPALATVGELAEDDTPRRSLATRIAIACIALVTAAMVGGVRANAAYADDGSWGDQRTSGDHHRDGDRTRSGDWSTHDGDARTGDRDRFDAHRRTEPAKQHAAEPQAATS